MKPYISVNDLSVLVALTSPVITIPLALVAFIAPPTVIPLPPVVLILPPIFTPSPPLNALKLPPTDIPLLA